MIESVVRGRNVRVFFEGNDLELINQALRLRVLRNKGRLGRTSRQRRIWRKIAFKELFEEAIYESIKENK